MNPPQYYRFFYDVIMNAPGEQNQTQKHEMLIACHSFNEAIVMFCINGRGKHNVQLQQSNITHVELATEVDYLASVKA